MPEPRVIGKVARTPKTLAYVESKGADAGTVREFRAGQKKEHHKKIGKVPVKPNHIYRVRKEGNVIEVPVMAHPRRGTKGVRSHKRRLK